jgi:hypothetical protein
MNPTEEQIEMYSFYSDVFKDVHNIRPRWKRPEDHSVDEWEAMINEIKVERDEMWLLEEQELEDEELDRFDELTLWYDTSAELD